MDVHEQVIEAKKVLHNAVVADWKSDIFSLKWIGMVAFILLSYYICFRLFDKRRIIHILLFGSFMAVGITLVDIFGTEFTCWTFNIRIFPIVPAPFLIDLTIIPLCYMLVFQYCSNWKSFSIINAITAITISFGLLPLFSALGIFKLVNWRYIYFIPIFFLMASFSRAVLFGFLSLQKKRIEIPK